MAKEKFDFDTVDFDSLKEQWKREKNQVRMPRAVPKEPCEKNFHILPPVTPGLFFREFWLHYGIQTIYPAATAFKAACIHKMLGQICPVCMECRALYNAAEVNGVRNKDMWAKAGGIRAKKRVVMNVVDADKPSDGVMTLEINDEAFEWVKALVNRNNFIVRPHPEKKKAVRIKFDRKGKYVTPTLIQESDDEAPYLGAIPVENWHEKLHDLDAYVQNYVVTAAQLKEWAQASKDFDVNRVVIVDDVNDTSDDEASDIVTAVKSNGLADDPTIAGLLAKLKKAGVQVEG